MFSMCCCGPSTHTVVTGCGSAPMPLVINMTVPTPSDPFNYWVPDTLTLGAIPAVVAGDPSFLTNWWYGAGTFTDGTGSFTFFYSAFCPNGGTWQVRSHYATGFTPGTATGYFRRWTFGTGLNTRSPFFVFSSPTKDSISGDASVVSASE